MLTLLQASRAELGTLVPDALLGEDGAPKAGAAFASVAELPQYVSNLDGHSRFVCRASGMAKGLHTGLCGVLGLRARSVAFPCCVPMIVRDRMHSTCDWEVCCC